MSPTSSNGSWSGESGEHKHKTSSPPVKPETLPGTDNDNSQQAQELHERCSGFLMSRKLRALAQQLTVIGFTLHMATEALICNEGSIEKSILWLIDGGVDYSGEINLKLDITEELAQIADLEARFKCSTQEVERAIVACEGDIQKATEA